MLICDLAIGISILFVIIIALFYIIKIIKWSNIKIYHIRYRDLPRLNRKLLIGELTNRYGKRQGRRLFYQIKDEIFNKFKIK